MIRVCEKIKFEIVKFNCDQYSRLRLPTMHNEIPDCGLLTDLSIFLFSDLSANLNLL